MTGSSPNSYWTDLSGDIIIDSDIAFNDADFVGRRRDGGSYDIQTVATHELGHSLNLRDLYGSGDTAKVMYGLTAPGVGPQAVARRPPIGTGIVWIYGARPPMSGALKANADAAFTTRTTITLTSSGAERHSDALLERQRRVERLGAVRRDEGRVDADHG